ncbi:DUF1320 domain-containing protein [Salmonella enterica subsp. enterica serovar Newport]|nr:DUF1320 domain-containing protein [Salmonella enterica subsp. enterica serovar Newport]
MYAVVADMVQRFGERHCAELTRAPRDGIDEAVMTNALIQASAEIDGYLVALYPTPWPDTPRILVGRCCDIARYQLTTAGRPLTDEIRLRYEDAIRFLEKVAAGTIRLGRDDSGSVYKPTAQARFISTPRRFSRDDTKGGAF